MQNGPLSLAQYPLLDTWYAEASCQTSPQDVHVSLCLAFCQSLAQATASTPLPALATWLEALRTLCRQGEGAAQSWERLEVFFTEKGAALQPLCAELTQLAVQEWPDERFVSVLADTAACLQQPSFYFLAAWAAFNRGLTAECLRLCAQPRQAYAPLCALRGQALLESGDAAAAILELELASELDANDPMIWFQLAKAEYASGDHAAAWQTLQVCSELRPSHPELAGFQAFLALLEPSRQDWQKSALHALTASLKLAREPGVVAALSLPLLRLALRVDEASWLEALRPHAEAGTWPQVVAAMLTEGGFGAILGQLGGKAWWGYVQLILPQAGER